MSKTEKATTFGGSLKASLIKFLKSRAIKAVLKKILGSASAGGIKGFIIKYIVTELFEEVAEPLIKLAFRKVGYIYEVQKGKHVLKRIEDAKTRDEWRDTVRDA